MGVTKGSVVFSCGTITRAGPHRALLTVNGLVEAVSPVLQVGWPILSIRVPASLETYATDVSIVVAFTTNICTPLMGAHSGNLHPKYVFTFDAVWKNMKFPLFCKIFRENKFIIMCTYTLISREFCLYFDFTGFLLKSNERSKLLRFPQCAF